MVEGAELLCSDLDDISIQVTWIIFPTRREAARVNCFRFRVLCCSVVSWFD